MSKPRTGSLAAAALVAATSVAFAIDKRAAGRTSATDNSSDDDSSAFARGLAFSFVALVGNTAVGLLRKYTSSVTRVGPAEQVGVAALLQGLFALAYCVREGLLGPGAPPPPASFWIPAICSSVLNSVTKTLETKAFSECDVSLCAPFLAFDPVMQFVVGVAVMPALCGAFDVGCLEAKSSFPPYHPLAVACVAAGAFLLSSGGGKGGSASSSKARAKKEDDDDVDDKDAAKKKKRHVRYLGPLPVGSWYILLNCVIYAFTSRMDKAAVQAAGKTLYYAYGRLLMAFTCLGGAAAASSASTGGGSSGRGGGGGLKRSLAEFATPKAASLVLAVCASEAVYMLSLYQAFASISPVYVTAIKRGGGVLMSSVLGMLLFGETMAGRGFPIAVVVFGVVLLCL